MALHSRIKRVNEELRSAIAEILLHELKDPRLDERIITVNQVGVAKDLHNAKVWVGVLGDEEQAREVLEALEHSRKYIRRLLGQRIVLRYLPDLHFELDPSVTHAVKINRLLSEVKSSERTDDDTQDEK